MALQPLAEIRAHFEVNVVGLISVTQAFLPLLDALVPDRFANFTILRLLPDRWLDRLIARKAGLTNAGRATAER